ncbi:hypothetical protein BST27_29245 [Mycobacterium intermedium]|uniref:Uncharacterized protein n=1 Tax=Mycobacterium intermedium TaxID=28445 RepID=A0A1E3S4B5_MYCIE|nr:hypothetical protein [Mycobacterium intermedium]MCV6966088.1 hypothetical protein [Mycobacterium intermedium]ODQ96512.1 hypothetical protein BHQ20_28870 [Mycobacterium intermedium]OPE48840.1 hypothetical protein BV508_16310 [Mycobacterium intermedium]ORA91825.1 hypothetical protein BST27_29245 [Mycobacterium intermedium]
MGTETFQFIAGLGDVLVQSAQRLSVDAHLNVLIFREKVATLVLGVEQQPLSGRALGVAAGFEFAEEGGID